MKHTTLPPRTVFKGYCYHKNQEFKMTGKEWHEYAKTDKFKCSPDKDNKDFTWNGVEVWSNK